MLWMHLLLSFHSEHIFPELSPGPHSSLPVISLLALLPPAVCSALFRVDRCWLTVGQGLCWVLGYSYREGQASLGILVRKPYPESAEAFLRKLSPAILHQSRVQSKTFLPSCFQTGSHSTSHFGPPGFSSVLALAPFLTWLLMLAQFGLSHLAYALAAPEDLASGALALACHRVTAVASLHLPCSPRTECITPP